jgi:hypothetical protein
MASIAKPEVSSWEMLEGKFPVLKGLDMLKGLHWVEGLSFPDSDQDSRYSAVLFRGGRTAVTLELDTSALAHRLSGMTVLVEIEDRALSFKRDLDDYGMGRVYSRHTVHPTERLNWVLRYENIESQLVDSSLPLEEFLNFAISLGN